MICQRFYSKACAKNKKNEENDGLSRHFGTSIKNYLYLCTRIT